MKRIFNLVFLLLTAGNLCAQMQQVPYAFFSDTSDYHWDDRFAATSLSGNGPEGYVRASLTVGNDLYLAGEFLYTGKLVVNHIVKWDGVHWSALGTGLNDYVMTLAWHDGALYAGGHFTNAGGVAASHIAKWDGTQWSALGSGVTSVQWYCTVNALAFVDDDLYAGGKFDHAGGVAVNNLAKWDGTQWSAGAGGTNGEVNTLATMGSDLYAGGDFTYAGPVSGGVSAAYIARYNGTQWSALGSGMNDEVSTLTVHGTDLFAGGFFSISGGITTNHIARWDGTYWNSLNSNIYGATGQCSVYSILFRDDMIYVGGCYDITGGAFDFTNIAKYNGNEWSNVGMGFMGYDQYTTVYTLAFLGTTLYAGGYFSVSGSEYLHNTARFDGTKWVPYGYGLGLGLDSWVNDLAVMDNKLYVVGNFTRAGDQEMHYVGIWDGNQWTEPDGGSCCLVCKLCNGENAMYMAGSFTYVGPNTNQTPAQCVVKWDGTQWQPLSPYPNFWTMLSLAYKDNKLYAGGNGGKLFVWDGTQWTIPGVTNGYEGLKAMAFMGNDLYVGGDFTTAGSDSAYYIARWDGSQWHPLGSGMNGQVLDILVVGNDLYACGWFTRAGGNQARYIARWDGSQWSEFGGGTDGFVNTLEYIDGHIYIGGDFLMAGNDSVSRIARWNGTGWDRFGSGMNHGGWGVTSIKKFGEDLYAGGYFEMAGGKPSSFIARWVRHPAGSEDPGPTDKISCLGQNTPNPFNETTEIRWHMPLRSKATLRVLDLLGKEIKVLLNEELPRGDYHITLDASGLPAGTWFYQLKAGNLVETRKMVIYR